jgi:quinol-cytochrome oxidoreductase complex cytochrome b subunit
METPKHLVPEWYFLPFYAILLFNPHKAAGIIVMGLIMLVIPFTYTGLRSNHYLIDRCLKFFIGY